MAILVSVEVAHKKAFASAMDWPGWSRSGKTEALALEALAGYGNRYAVAAAEASLAFPSIGAADLDIVERVPGGSGTEFGVPSVVTDLDRRPLTAEDADRVAALVEAAWSVLDRVVAGSPAELRKGPRGGGRDRDKMFGHVVDSDWYYSREMGVRIAQSDPQDRAALVAGRAAMLEILRQPSDDAPLAGRRWPARYAARRIAWHALDHAWEMEDRSAPAE